MSFDTLGELQKRHSSSKIGIFLFFFYFTWNLYLSLKDYKCHLCNVKFRKRKSTFCEISQILQLALFFKVCPREILQTVSDQETKLLWNKRIYSGKKSGFKRF